MFTDRRKDKEAVVHICNGILLAHIQNALESVLTRQTNLEPIRQSDVSQKEKHKYLILKHIYGIQKNGTDGSICRAGREMQTQRTDLRTWCGGWGGTETVAGHRVRTICKQPASGDLLHGSESASPGPGTAYRARWGRRQLRREGTRAYLWSMHAGTWQKPTQHP